MAKNENGRVTAEKSAADVEVEAAAEFEVAEKESKAVEVDEKERQAEEARKAEFAAAVAAEVAKLTAKAVAQEVASSETIKDEEQPDIDDKSDFEKKTIISDMNVIRRPYQLNGKTCYNYFVKVPLRGSFIECEFTAPREDRLCYELLNFIYEDSKQVKLALVRNIKRDMSNKVIKRSFDFEACVTDTDGMVYHCPIVPRSRSNSAIIDMYLAKNGIKA